MHETELHEDAVPVNNMGTESRREERGDNRISNRELFEHHPHYPRKVSEEPLEPHELIHLVFVYAKGDYETFSSFLELVKDILGTIENGDTVTYETHDSELFPGQHDDNVHDICERAMFILPFLSPSFCCDRMLRFFTSEAIGRTRLDSTCPEGELENTIKKQKKYAVRPIHSADPQSGTYRIPTGLTMTKSIDFYSKDKHMGYVRNQVIGIIKEAIRKFDERKAAMVNALTGEDQLFETFEPPPTGPSIASSLQENTAAPPLMPNEYGIQEQPVDNIGLGENLTQITESVAAEADGNASMTNNASSDTQGNMHLKSKASSNDETTFLKTSTTPEDNIVALLADERNVCTDDSNGFSPAMSQDDISLEIDLGSLSHDTEIIKTFKTAKDQVLFNF